MPSRQLLLSPALESWFHADRAPRPAEHHERWSPITACSPASLRVRTAPMPRSMLRRACPHHQVEAPAAGGKLALAHHLAGVATRGNDPPAGGLYSAAKTKRPTSAFSTNRLERIVNVRGKRRTQIVSALVHKDALRALPGCPSPAKNAVAATRPRPHFRWRPA